MFLQEETRTYTHTGKPYGDPRRWQPSTSQGQRPQGKATPWSYLLHLIATFWPQTCIFQNCGKINFCCLSHSVCGTSSWHPEQTNPLSSDRKDECNWIGNPTFSAFFLQQMKTWALLVFWLLCLSVCFFCGGRGGRQRYLGREHLNSKFKSTVVKPLPGAQKGDWEREPHFKFPSALTVPPRPPTLLNPHLLSPTPFLFLPGWKVGKHQLDFQSTFSSLGSELVLYEQFYPGSSSPVFGAELNVLQKNGCQRPQLLLPSSWCIMCFPVCISTTNKPPWKVFPGSLNQQP